MTIFRQEPDEVPEIGDIVGIFYGSEMNSRIWLDKGYLAFENLPLFIAPGHGCLARLKTRNKKE
jgi:hypothetical protein